MQATAAVEVAPPATTPPARPKVLVVDDNVGLAEIWSFVLEDAGCEVTIADSGGAALAAASRELFDLAVLDLQMPDLNGLEVFTALRADNPDVEGVIITGHASMESAMDAVNAGLYGYMVKPVAPDALRVTVERALERQRLAAENRRMLSHLGALQEVLDTALQSVGLADAFQRMAQAVVDAMKVDQVTLLLQEPGGDLVVAGAFPSHDGKRTQTRIRPGEGFAGRVFAENRPLQLRDVQHATLASPYLPQLGIRSLLGAPVTSGGRPIGVLHVGTRRDREFSDHEVNLLVAITEPVALAVEKARLLEEREQHLRELEIAYRRQRHIAEALQRAFLPGVPVHTPGIDVAHRYKAALAEAEVGGDFYDILPLQDGTVALLMGDVSGKGLDAAVYTALTKYTVRSYALENPDPKHVMEALNRAFLRQAGPEIFATLFYGVLDPATHRLRYTNAGHEPALLYRVGGGRTEQLCSTGPLAGVIEDADYPTEAVQLEAGDLLLLYTDGATDAARGSEWLGTEGLQRILEQHLQPDTQAMLEAIYASILEFARGSLRDDIALMLVRAT